MLSRRFSWKKNEDQADTQRPVDDGNADLQTAQVVEDLVSTDTPADAIQGSGNVATEQLDTIAESSVEEGAATNSKEANRRSWRPSFGNKPKQADPAEERVEVEPAEEPQQQTSWFPSSVSGWYKFRRNKSQAEDEDQVDPKPSWTVDDLHVNSALLKYSRCMMQWPGLFILAYFGLIAAVTVPFMRPINISSSWEDYTVADSPEKLYSDSERFAKSFSSFIHIAADEGVATTTKTTTTSGLEYAYYYRLTFYYIAKSGRAVDDDLLWEVKQFEDRLRNLKNYRELCQAVLEDWRFSCDPGWSIHAFMWPSEIDPEREYQMRNFQFDGAGTSPLNLRAVMEASKIDGTFHSFFPTDYTLPPYDSSLPLGGGLGSPSALSSTFMFYLPLSEAGKYESFIRNDVFPFIQQEKYRFESFELVYSGTVISLYEYWQAFLGDCLLPIGALVVIALYLFVQTRSILLSVISLLVIMLSIPFGYAVLPVSEMRLTSLFAVFLMLGIGADNIFVFTQFWDQSKELTADSQRRMAWTIEQSVISCLATTLTTSASFFANLASVLSPLREFGFFVGMCVVGCFLWVSLIIPPSLAIMARFKDWKWPCEDKMEWMWRWGSSRYLDSETMSLSSGLGLTPQEISRLASIGLTEEELLRKLTDPTSSDFGEEDMKRLADIGFTDAVLQRIPGLRRAATVASQPSFGQKSLFLLGKKLQRFPHVCAAIFLLAFGGFIAGILLNTRVDLQMPPLLPESHNYRRAEEVRYRFLPVAFGQQRMQRGGLCDPQAQEVDACLLLWCEAETINFDAAVVAEGLDAGEDADWVTGSFVPLLDCWRSPTTPSIESCDTVNLHMQVATLADPVVGLESQIIDFWSQHISSGELDGVDFNRSLLDQVNFTWEPLNVPLGIENWEVGGVEVQQVWNLGNITMPVFNATSNSSVACDSYTMCTMARTRCKMNNWKQVGQFRYQPPPEGTSSEIEFAGAQPASQGEGPVGLSGSAEADTSGGGYTTSVTVVWGVVPQSSYPLLGGGGDSALLDTSFDLSDPWAQRALYKFCTEDVPLHFAVARSYCWIKDFRDWLVKDDKYFPSMDLVADVTEWQRFSDADHFRSVAVSEEGGKRLRVMGMVTNGTDGRVATTWMEFSCYVNDTSQEEVMRFMHAWRLFVDVWNTQASDSSNKAFVSSSAAVYAYTNISILSSTLETVLIAALSAFVAILMFTCSPVLAVWVTVPVLFIITGLLFFMTTMMQWTIGPIDILSLIIFVGYSVTYSLHVAHAYYHVASNDPELMDLAFRHTQEPITPSERKFGLRRGKLRKARSAMAVYRLGGAITSSAVSTMAASSFLLFCTFSPFPKMGWVILAVTFLSFIVALLALPSLLMIAGPIPILQCLPRSLLKRFQHGDVEEKFDLESEMHMQGSPAPEEMPSETKPADQDLDAATTGGKATPEERFGMGADLQRKEEDQLQGSGERRANQESDDSGTASALHQKKALEAQGVEEPQGSEQGKRKSWRPSRPSFGSWKAR
mmetsp:Transcript_87191/g.154417  ORF Transcript_87191/g.154417 Transcript_87191/m.154417 type:complete len:1509 (-) Transcript_87191:192-4718(-)